MRLPHVALMASLSLACNPSPRPMEPTGDAADMTGGGEDAGGGATDGGGDAARPDTCPVPPGEFQVDVPPGPGRDTTRQHAVLQMPATGTPRVYVSQFYQNGSFYEATLQRLVRNGAMSWQAQQVASGGTGLSIARSLAVTHGADPCVAYTYDANGALRLQCASLSDRIIAPRATGSVALGAAGAAKQVVYEDGNANTLSWVEVNPTAGTPEVIEGAVWSFGGAAMEVDAMGRPHVVYATLRSGSPIGRTVRYATRGRDGWTRETIDTDTWGSSSPEGVSLSLVLVSGSPVVAYYHRATRSLKLARRGRGGWTTRALATPPMGFPDDTVGRSVALAVDCMDRIHLVFQRDFSTDPKPKLGLFWATLQANDTLSPAVPLPMTASTAYTFASRVHGLSFFVAADGRQTVAAELGSIYGSAVYFAQR